MSSVSGAPSRMIQLVWNDRRRETLRIRAREYRKYWQQYRTNRGGMIGLIMMIVFLVMAIFAPILATHSNPDDLRWRTIDNEHTPYRAPDLPFEVTWPIGSDDVLFGTDDMGRDVYSLTVYGSRASLIVGILASLISIVIGAAIGISSGFFGRFSDEILMRLTDFFLVIPWFPLMIVIASLMGRSFENVIIVIGITSWPSTARIVRAQVLSVKEMGFVERARAIGASDGHIIVKHITPNVFPLIFANTVLLVANSIFSEAFLDFFGLGDPEVISWGTMLESAYEAGAFTSFAWWYIMAPGACIVLLIMSFYLIGDAVDEVMNPRLRRR